MKILIISTVKPYEGSGTGLTEYAYQLIKHMEPLLSKQDSIEELYALDNTERQAIKGIINIV